MIFIRVSAYGGTKNVRLNVAHIACYYPVNDAEYLAQRLRTIIALGHEKYTQLMNVYETPEQIDKLIETAGMVEL